MSYKIENVNDCTRKLLFNFDAVDLSSQIENALVKKQKESNLKGFRKGKAPIAVVKQLYGAQVENEALYQFITQEYFEAMKKESLRPVGYPQFNNTNYEAEKRSVSFEVKVEIFPEVSLKPYEKYSFEKEATVLEDKEFEATKNRYLESKAQMIAIEENVALENGHTAVMNFQGIMSDGEKPENMKGEEYMLEIGSGQFIPGFEEQMVGMKKDEKRDLKVTFPADYHAEHLKNSEVTFEVELLEIKKKVLPDFTDELAKEFGYESVEDFTAKTKSLLLANKERASREKLNQAIIEKLVEDNAFDVPASLVAQQRDSIEKDISSNLKRQGFNDAMVADYFTKWNDDIQKKAEFQVRSGLILDHLANHYEIETTEDDLVAKIEEMSQGAGMGVEELKKMYLGNEQIKSNMRYVIREEKTFNKLAEVMNVK